MPESSVVLPLLLKLTPERSIASPGANPPITSLGTAAPSMRSTAPAPAKSMGRPAAAPALVNSSVAPPPMTKFPVNPLPLVDRLSVSVPPDTTTAPLPAIADRLCVLPLNTNVPPINELWVVPEDSTMVAPILIAVSLATPPAMSSTPPLSIAVVTAVPPLKTFWLPPLKMAVPLAAAPEETFTVPPLSSALTMTPPDNTFTVPPLRTMRLLSVWPAETVNVTPLLTVPADATS